MEGAVKQLIDYGTLGVAVILLGWFAVRLVWWIIKESATALREKDKQLRTAYSQRIETSDALADAMRGYTEALDRLADEQRRLRRAVERSLRDGTEDENHTSSD